jgi:hypothetical protein
MPRQRLSPVADVLADVQDLYAAGADYVLSSRIVEARELLSVVAAAENGLLVDMRKAFESRMSKREEVLP